jgi:ABC-2 type transport system permease protein
MLCIAAAMWGSSVISKEERDKTVEFSLTLPVTRSRLITAKTLAMLVNCIVLLIVNTITIWVGVMKFEPDTEFYRFVGLCMLSVLILQLIFLAIGIFLGCALKKHKLAGAISIWILVGAYILSILIGLEEDLDFLKYLTPFKYFDPIRLLNESSFDPVFVLLSAGIIVACMAGAYLTYARRDLYI